MDTNTTGKNNVAVGHDALGANTTADANNTAVGQDALLAIHYRVLKMLQLVRVQQMLLLQVTMLLLLVL